MPGIVRLISFIASHSTWPYFSFPSWAFEKKRENCKYTHKILWNCRFPPHFFEITDFLNSSKLFSISMKNAFKPNLNPFYRVYYAKFITSTSKPSCCPINWYITCRPWVPRIPTPRTIKLAFWRFMLITDSAFSRPSWSTASRRWKNVIFRLIWLRILVIWISGGGWRGMGCISIEVVKIKSDNRLLVCLFIGFEGENGPDITLWMLFSVENNWEGMATWIAGWLADWTSTGMFCKMDNVIATSFDRFDFVEDPWNRRNSVEEYAAS